MRKARIKSETGLYHVCIRGVNRQDIFFDDYDKMLASGENNLHESGEINQKKSKEKSHYQF